MCLWFLCSGSRASKTFKPKKNIPEGTHQYDLMKQAAATLGSGNLRLAVMLPEGEDLNEWVSWPLVLFWSHLAFGRLVNRSARFGRTQQSFDCCWFIR